MKQVEGQALTIGSRVHSILYGGRDGIVFDIRGEQSPETVAHMGGGIISRGGRATFDIVFLNGDISRAEPECTIRGVQWRLLDGLASGEEIAAAITNSALIRAEKEVKAEEVKAAYIARVGALKTSAEFAYLRQGADSYSGKLAAANVRVELKKSFPGVKFSVRKVHYGTVNVSWTDGPTAAQVETIANKYQGGSFDGMNDIYEYDEKPFNVVYGGCKYLFTRRDASPELIMRAIEKAKNYWGIDGDYSAEDFKMGRLWSVHPANAGHDLQSLVHQQLCQMPA